MAIIATYKKIDEIHTNRNFQHLTNSKNDNFSQVSNIYFYKKYIFFEFYSLAECIEMRMWINLINETLAHHAFLE